MYLAKALWLAVAALAILGPFGYAAIIIHPHAEDGIIRAKPNIPKLWSQPVPLDKRVDMIVGSTNNFEYPHALEDTIETWSIQLTHFISAVPIESAAEALERFYTYASDTVDLYIGRDLDDLQDFTLRLGNVVLEVFCGDFICWNIVHAFLLQMRQLTANGGPLGRYEGYVVNVATRFSIFVRLGIQARGPGPEA